MRGIRGRRYPRERTDYGQQGEDFEGLAVLSCFMLLIVILALAIAMLLSSAFTGCDGGISADPDTAVLQDERPPITIRDALDPKRCK